MDLNEKIVVPVLTKIAEYLASGIGGAAGPLLAPWKARREAEAKRVTAQGHADAQRILADGHSDALQIVAKATADTRELLSNPLTVLQGQIELGEMVAQKIQFQEEKRLANQLSVVRKTIEEAGDSVVPDQEPDHDWTARFFNYIQDVSSDEMQTLWAKILAGEVQRPGGTSLRTLSILRNLDKGAASLFRTFCSACVIIQPIEGVFADARVLSLGGRPGENALQKYGLSYDLLNVLNEHGLIISDYDSWYDYGLCLGKRVSEAEVIRIPFSYQGRHWFLVSINQHDAVEEIRLSGVALTRSGRELSRVVDIQSMEEYTQDIKAFFESKSLRMVEVPFGQPFVTQEKQTQR